MTSDLARFRILLAPGLHDSGEGHWQTHWESMLRAERIEQRDWACPDLPAWSAQVGHALRRSARPALVVAHSFGCLATVHRAALGAPGLAGVLLVAPASPHKFGVADALAPVRLTVPAIVVGSENDPWMALAQARQWAGTWGAEFVNAGALGHINAESGLDAWPGGLGHLARLARAVPARSRCSCAA
jgi:predicted alpha/beta hydrolase family esterase